MKKDNKIKIFTITLITAIIMGISSITIYSNVCAPKFYDYFIDTGVKYLMDGKYEEAISSLTRLKQADPKNYRLYIDLADCYMKLDQKQSAIDILHEFQRLGIKSQAINEMLEKIQNTQNTARPFGM